MSSQELAAVMIRETDVDAGRVQEAVERQVVGGGGLDTAVMEMGLIDEQHLLPLLEKVYGLPSVGREDIRRIDAGAVAVFPQRLAEKHGIVPLELSGRRLSVAVAHKPDLTLLDEIGFMLSVYVRPFVTTEARLAYGLYRLYGVPLPPRMENLLGMMGEDPVAEIEDERGSASAAEDASQGAVSSDAEPTEDDEGGAPASADAPPASSPAGKGTDAGPWQVEGTGKAHLDDHDEGQPAFNFTPAQSESALLGGRVDEVQAPTADDHVAEDSSTPEAVATRDAEPDVGAPPQAPDAAPQEDSADVQAPAGSEEEREAMRQRLLAAVDADEAAARERADARRNERVRWTVDDAIAELAMAGDRDAMVDVVLRFAHRRLTTSAMLVVHKDHFSGWDIIDPVLDRGDIIKLSIPVGGDHVLGKLYEMRSPSLGPMADGDPLAAALGRAPRAALLVPVMVEDKLAAVLYGDCGEKSVPPSSLAELHMVAPRFGKALRNLILRNRHGGAAEGAAAVAAPERPEIEPAAKARELPAIELDLDDFDEVIDGSTPGRPSPPMATDPTLAAAAAAEPAADEIVEVDVASLDGEPVDEAAAQVAALSDPEDDIETTDLDVVSEKTVAEADAARVDDEDDVLDADEVGAEAEDDAAEASAGGEEDLDIALDGMASASEGSFGAPDGAASVASVVGVEVDMNPTLVPSVAAAFAEGADSAEQLVVEEDDELHDEGEDLEEDEDDLPEPTDPRVGAVAGELLERGDDELQFKQAYAERDPNTPPPIPRLKRKARNRGRIPGAPGPTARDGKPRGPSPIAARAAAAAAPGLQTEVPSGPRSVVAPEETQLVDAASAEPAAAEGATAPAELASAPLEPEAPPAQATVDEAETESSRPERHVAANTTPPTIAPPSTAPVVATSPGADARDTLLLATWRDWVEHETPEVDELLVELQQHGEPGRAAVAKVVSYEDAAMPALARYFPGVLKVHPFGHMESRPDVREFSDALSCLVRLGADRAAPILVAEVNDDDRLHRYAAIWALSELQVPAALKSLAQRVFDPEYRIALLVLEVLQHYRAAPHFPKIVEQLRRMVKQGNEFERKRAILAVSELKDREVLPHLVDLLGTRPKDIAEEAHRALVNLTKQDFGNSGRRWRAWVADHQNNHRIEWLIGGLAHKSEEIRAMAQAELNHLTGLYHGYRYDAPRAERDQSVQRWRTWWTDEADPSAYP